MNNFTQSATGVSIEVSVYYDVDMGQINRSNNFKKLEFEEDTYIYLAQGNLSSEVCYDPIEEGQKTKMIQAIMEELPNEYTRAELSKRTSDVYNIYYNMSYDMEDLLTQSRKYDIKLLRDTDFTEFISYGYSQGDCIKVLVNTKEFESVMGVVLDANTMQKEIDNILWDTPQIVQCTINGEEYYSTKFDGWYNNYDKDEFIEELLKFTKNEDIDKTILKQELENTLPDECTYKY